MSKILPAALAVFLMMSPAYAYEPVSIKDGGSASASVILNSDTGSYMAGFSSGKIHSWTDSVTDMIESIRNLESGSAAAEIPNPGYIYWKLRSTGSYSIYLFRNDEALADDDGRTIPWKVEVAELESSGSETSWMTVAVNENPENVSGYIPVFSRNFNGVMDIDVNSLPLRITVGPVDDSITSGEFRGSLTLNLVSGG